MLHKRDFEAVDWDIGDGDVPSPALGQRNFNDEAPISTPKAGSWWYSTDTADSSPRFLQCSHQPDSIAFPRGNPPDVTPSPERTPPKVWRGVKSLHMAVAWFIVAVFLVRVAIALQAAVSTPRETPAPATSLHHNQPPITEGGGARSLSSLEDIALDPHPAAGEPGQESTAGAEAAGHAHTNHWDSLFADVCSAASHDAETCVPEEPEAEAVAPQSESGSETSSASEQHVQPEAEAESEVGEWDAEEEEEEEEEDDFDENESEESDDDE